MYQAKYRRSSATHGATSTCSSLSGVLHRFLPPLFKGGLVALCHYLTQTYSKCVIHWYEVPTGFCYEIIDFHWILLENHCFWEVFVNLETAKVNYISMHPLEK